MNNSDDFYRHAYARGRTSYPPEEAVLGGTSVLECLKQNDPLPNQRLIRYEQFLSIFNTPLHTPSEASSS